MSLRLLGYDLEGTGVSGLSGALPRVVIAALAGDAGKTLVSLGLVRALCNRGHVVAPYKKGPDYIDAAWLGAAARRPARNLDTFIMPHQAVLGSLGWAGEEAEIALIEGNRGLFDGLDALGSHSTAQLARLTKTPLVLIVDATKATRTIAAQVLGCQHMDPHLEIAGVIVNRLGTKRQEEIIRTSIRNATGLEVFGCIPKLADPRLPSRHLGLVPNAEHPTSVEVIERLSGIAERYLNVPAILEAAQKASRLPVDNTQVSTEKVKSDRSVRVAVLRDPGFSFYYPENLAGLESQGAELVYVSPLIDHELPVVHALYAGGGFPEIYAAALSANHSFRQDLAGKIRQGLPVWAECGGLMYLSRALVSEDSTYPMVGVIDVVCEQTSRPQGHGYVRLRVDGKNPFISLGTEIRGHEFHYSLIKSGLEGVNTVFSVERGVGLGNGRDGILAGNLVAAYTHIHALGLPQWSKVFIDAAEGRCGFGQTVHSSNTARRSNPHAKGVESHRMEAYRKDSLSRAAARHHAGGRKRSQDCGSSRVRLPYFGPKLSKGHEDGISKGLRGRVERLVRSKKVNELTALVARQARAVRYLVGLSYLPDEEVRKIAAQGIARAGRFHPDLVQSVIRRLIWAMNDESGTNAITAPEVLRAVSEEQPELLLPMVPDLVRLSEDESLRQGLAGTLQAVAQNYPGQFDEQIGSLLSRAEDGGGCCGASCQV